MPINPKLQAKINKNRKDKKKVDEETIAPNQYEDVAKDLDKESTDVKFANNLWDDIKRRVKEDPDFVNMEDRKKVELYQKGEFKDFYTTYPIVCRYMICMGQFSNKAFKRFLNKCKVMAKEAKPGEGEDQWIMRQADYVRYLWEAYQKGRFKAEDSQAIWKHSYDTLTKEFKDFKDMHKDTEEKLKRDEKFNKAALVKELTSRIANNEQQLNKESEQKLLQSLKLRLAQQRRKLLLESIRELPKIQPTRICRGSVKEEPIERPDTMLAPPKQPDKKLDTISE